MRTWRKRLVTWRWRLLLVVAAVGLMAASGVAWYKTRPYHFRVVAPGVLYRSGWMSDRDLRHELRQRQIKTVVNLCLPSEAVFVARATSEAAICKEAGAQVVYLPLPGNSPPTEAQRQEWLGLLAQPANWPILVHCHQGVIRTNIMVAIYLLEGTLREPEAVWAALPDFGHDLNSPKRGPILQYLRDYRSRQKTAVPAALAPQVSQAPAASEG